MGNIWNCIKLAPEVKDGKKVSSIIRNDIEIFEDIPENEIDELIAKLEKQAQSKKKTPSEYLDELALKKIKKRLKFDIEEFIKLRNHFKLKSADEILRLYKRTVTFHHTDVVPLYNDIISKYPKLKGELNDAGSFMQKNIATFKTQYISNGKKEVVNELVHSGKETLYPKDFVNTYDSSDELVTMFKKGVVDSKGRPRMSDSEVKYIFNFMMHHLHKSDTFVIETKNIYYACNSCQREFLMFEEFLKARGKTVKFIIHSDEGILGGDDFYKLLIKK